MKSILAIFVIAFFLLAGCAQPQQENTLTIYTYDSMVSEYGLGPKVIPKFESECDCNVKIVSKGDAGALLAALILEKNNPKADVVIGLDNSLLYEAIENDVLEKFTPSNSALISENARFAEDGYLTAYDYGYFAFVYDANAVPFEPQGFNDLLDSRLRKKIVIQNPRTSSPGLGLLLWSVAVYGDPGYKEFWREFKPNILTVTQGWDESAGLFAAGEAPMYLSYATSPPYYAEFEGKTNYLAAGFSEGHYLQVEGSGIVKGTKKRALAEKFIEFSLTEEFQGEIPFTQFMFPVNSSVELPQAFEEYALMPEKKLELQPRLVAEKQGEWILEWEKIMQSG